MDEVFRLLSPTSFIHRIKPEIFLTFKLGFYYFTICCHKKATLGQQLIGFYYKVLFEIHYYKIHPIFVMKSMINIYILISSYYPFRLLHAITTKIKGLFTFCICSSILFLLMRISDGARYLEFGDAFLQEIKKLQKIMKL